MAVGEGGRTELAFLFPLEGGANAKSAHKMQSKDLHFMMIPAAGQMGKYTESGRKRFHH
jgi:hypothetical protein